MIKLMMNDEMVAEAVASTKIEIVNMTDAEVHMWAGKWAELALNASWNPMNVAMAEVFATENINRAKNRSSK